MAKILRLKKIGDLPASFSFAVIFIAALLAVPMAGCNEDGEGPFERPAMIIAHRGVNKFAPENTLPAIEMAIEMDLDYVEIDVRTTKDARLVLMHDNTVDGTTDGSGRVRDLTAEEIRALDAGSWFSPEYEGTTVPFLEEALEVMQGRIGVYVDLKDARPRDLVEALRDAGMIDASVIYADPFRQFVLKCREPDIRVMPEVGNSRALLNLMRFLLRPDVVAISWGEPTKDFVEKIHSHGIEAFMDILGDMDNPEGMTAAIDMGLDALQTNHPDTLLEVMGE
ncbi:glycerophosphodiester phosphodiesterase [Thermodesulfobacteriota bacterium]